MITSIKTIEELEERLSRPTAAAVSDMAALDGDLLILGAGGNGAQPVRSGPQSSGSGESQ